MGLVLSGQAICHGSLDDSACLQPPNSTLKYRAIGQASFKRSLDQPANVLSLIIKSVQITQRHRKIATVSMIIV